MTALVGYMLLFLVIAVAFVLVHLMIGKLIRPARPSAEKMTIYECGEPTIGSAWVQFDLRFYVIALLFVVFDVEVAFFFPWAVVFGQCNTLADPLQSRENQAAALSALTPDYPEHAARRQHLLDVLNKDPQSRTDADQKDLMALQASAHTMAWIAFFDILVFFGVLLVGFAYLWRRGDLVWVRSTAAERFAATAPPPPPPTPGGEVLVGAGEGQ